MKQKKQLLFVFFLLIGTLLSALPMQGFARTVVMRVSILCIASLGVYICYAVSHMMILCQAGFLAVGAYTSGMILKTMKSSGKMLSTLVAMTGAVFAGLLIAWVLSFAILKLQGDYFSIATIGAGEVLRIFFQICEELGSASGLYNIPQRTQPFLTTCLLAACTLFFLRMEGGWMFQKFRAVKSDMQAAQSIGIHVIRQRRIALMMCASLGALAGGLMAGQNGFISPSDFTFLRSMDCVSAVVIGGFTSPIGTVLAAGGLELTTILFQMFSEIRMIFYGVLLIGAAWYRSSRSRQKKGV